MNTMHDATEYNAAVDALIAEGFAIAGTDHAADETGSYHATRLFRGSDGEQRYLALEVEIEA